MDKNISKKSFTMNSEDIIKYFSSNSNTDNSQNFARDIDFTVNKIFMASEILQKGFLSEAKQIYDSILANVNLMQNPIYDMIKQLCYHHISTIYLFNEEFSKARDYLSKAVDYCKVVDDKMLLKKMLGESLFGCKEYKSAQKIFRELIKANYKESLNCKVWLARCLYYEDIKKNGQNALDILEKDVLKLDPENIDALIYISEIAIKRGKGRCVVDHLAMALGFHIGGKSVVSKEVIKTGKYYFCELMKDEENLKFFDKFQSQIPVYNFLIQILKENGLMEIVINLQLKAINFISVKNEIREIINFTLNIVTNYEIVNKFQKGFDFYINFMKNYPNISVNGLLSNDIYNLIADIKDIYSEDLRKGFDETPLKPGWYCLNKDENLNPYSTAELDFIGLQFQVFKMLFLSGALRCLPKLAKMLIPLTKGRALHDTSIKTETAFFMLCANLLNSIEFAPYKEKIYICGDGHSLVPSWHVINGKLIVPKLVTGIKCWHLRKDCLFFPKLNFEKVVESIPDNSTVIFIIGEIDCKEGIYHTLQKCKFNTEQEAIKTTADILLNKLKTLKVTRDFKCLIHPIAPVMDSYRNFTILFNDYFKQQKIIQYMDFGDLLLENDRKDMKKIYVVGDGAHLSPSYIDLLKQFI